MAYTNLSVKDAAAATKTVAAHLKGGSDYYPAHVMVPVNEGGLSVYRSASLINTGVNAKASAGQLYCIEIANMNASARYVKFYDKASAPSSSDTPVMTIYMAGSSGRTINLTDMGVAFANGIGLRASTGSGDSDNTAPSANDIYISVFYN